LAAGLGIDSGVLATGGLFAIVVVVTGTVVVGVGATVVVGRASVVVVGVADDEGTPFNDDVGRDVVATCARRDAACDCEPRVRRWPVPLGDVSTTERELTLVEGATRDGADKFVDGATTFAMAGSAVVPSTTPATRKLSDPTTTERRGARFECRVGSPRLFCPCVFNMHQLSETHSKLASTTAQHPLNSVGNIEY
jgi:hypothetical protein